MKEHQEPEMLLQAHLVLFRFYLLSIYNGSTYKVEAGFQQTNVAWESNGQRMTSGWKSYTLVMAGDRIQQVQALYIFL
jgi:hypothetical protein